MSGGEPPSPVKSADKPIGGPAAGERKRPAPVKERAACWRLADGTLYSPFEQGWQPAKNEE